MGSPGSVEEEEVKETLISSLLEFRKPKGGNEAVGENKKYVVSSSHFNDKPRVQTRIECFGVLCRHKKSFKLQDFVIISHVRWPR